MVICRTINSIFLSSILFGIAVFSLGTLAFEAIADTFLVTKTTDDNGACTVDDCALREAVMAANGNPGMDVIDVPGGTYQLTLIGRDEYGYGLAGDLDVRDDLEIRGESAATVTIIGTGTDRVIQVFGITAPSTVVFSMSGVTITGGRTNESGGGIRLGGSIATISDSTIRDNTTALSRGGGIFAGLSDVTLINSAVINNTAIGPGGGIYLDGATITLPTNFYAINSTISDNTASGGGGVFAETSNASFSQTSIVNNNALGKGDAFFGLSSQDVVFTNSIIAGDCRFPSFAPPTSNGGNIESPGATCMLNEPTDRMNVPDPLLAPLGFNGGTTMTHAPLPGSPVIDTALEANCEATDQRGVPRPQDGDGDGSAECDVGAYELTGFPVTDVPTLGGFGLIVLSVLMGLAGWTAVRWRRG